jgi:hypothetical protein
LGSTTIYLDAPAGIGLGRPKKPGPYHLSKPGINALECQVKNLLEEFTLAVAA